ncbi:MAG: diguanylate cyclase [Deltaproteobacteria bacterium]|nr:diguanylate cyclase [Deltaproteobacteria bacterium]
MSDPHQGLARPPLSGLATKIILFVFLSTLTTGGVVSWISIQSTHTQLERALDRAYPAELAVSAEDIRSLLKAAEHELRRHARNPVITRQRSNRLAPLSATAARLLEASDYFSGLAVVDRNHALRMAIGAAQAVPSEVLERSFPKREGDGPWALDSNLDAHGSVIAVPIVTGTRRLGALVGTLRPSVVRAALAQAGPPEADATYLLDARGRVLVGAGAGEGRTGLALDALVSGEPGLRDYEDVNGRQVLGGAAPLGALGWHLAAEVPFERAFEPVMKVVTQTFAVNLAILLVFGFLAFSITTTAVKPIETLSDGARRIAQGRFDVEIPEPKRHDEISLLTRVFNDIVRQLRRKQIEIDSTARTLRERNLALEQANEVLSQLSITDGLTKLHNHRYFQDHLTREIKRVGRVNEPLSMLIIDIDDFKSLNDRLGHAAGDEFLSGLAQILMNTVRETDLLARYGGEEFVMLCSNTDLEGAYQLGEKVRTAIEDASFILDESMRPMRLTVSVGAAQFDGNRKHFFKAADRALYRAKDQGKNCVVADDPNGML